MVPMKADQARKDIARFLERTGWTLNRLAVEAKINRPTIYRFMNDEGNVNMATLEKLQPIVWPEDKAD